MTNISACKSEHLQQRGWTLQEHVFSPRVLTFNSYRMRWGCASEHYADDQGGEPYVDRQLDVQRITSEFSERSVPLSEDEKIMIYLEWKKLYWNTLGEA